MDLCPCKKSASRLSVPRTLRQTKSCLEYIALERRAELRLTVVACSQRLGGYSRLAWISQICLIPSHPPPLGPRPQVSLQYTPQLLPSPSPQGTQCSLFIPLAGCEPVHSYVTGCHHLSLTAPFLLDTTPLPYLYIPVHTLFPNNASPSPTG